MESKKTNILCFFPGPTYFPKMIDFTGRFEMLSDKYEGEIYSWSCQEENQEIKMGAFTYRDCLNKTESYTKWKMLWHIVKHATAYQKEKKVDLIICYEPLFTGLIGAFLKKKFKCKLIIELNNSNLAEAITAEAGTGLKTRLKIHFANLLRSFSLRHSDGIKLLTKNQLVDLEEKYHTKVVHCFHDFVPTHFFKDAVKQTKPHILFVGFPFYRKAVDVLVKAFEKIVQQYPEFELHLIGHLLEDDAKKYLGTWHKNIKFIKPMSYEDLQPHFLNCYCFVLPSREEGMGRVLLEAMASGKSIIGCNVGGIPALVENGVNGLLFEKEDTNGLAVCLNRLLENPHINQKMGEASELAINEKFSSEKYVQYLDAMIKEVLLV
jgi:glycosyltransferase involved in cell wall biosynthesis